MIEKFSMMGVKSYTELDINAIKALYADLKKRREVLTWGEFAEAIDSDRSYLSLVINGKEPLTDGLKKKVFNAFFKPTGNVGNATGSKKEQIALVISKTDLDDVKEMISKLASTIAENQTLLLTALGKGPGTEEPHVKSYRKPDQKIYKKGK